VNLDITYQFMIPMLMFFKNLTHSYGWSIVLLTLAVRMLVWPLVANQTKSMQRMSGLQPKMKEIQERYKGDPEAQQKKLVEFYAKNKINPMGGCLPLLIQLPILLALFGTFTGPPFGDKTVDVKVKVVDQAQAKEAHRNEVSGGNVPYVAADGMLAKVVVFPGDLTIVQGESADFGVRALQGTLPPDFKVFWEIVGKKEQMEGVQIKQNPDSATLHTPEFTHPGEYTVKARVRGIAKDESFAFINGLGKVAKGADLLRPANWDSVVLILLFGGTMWLSQKFTVAKQQPGLKLDEQAMAQQQAMKSMPLMVTGMFFFIPLPTGVYLYMVISNVMQSLQTWIIMQQPAPALVDVMGDEPVAEAVTTDEEANGNGTGKKKKKKK
jgi:YidC/Oxa1 family membrane protein insertase